MLFISAGVVSLMLIDGSAALAHDPGLSAALITLDKHRVLARVSLAPADAEALRQAGTLPNQNQRYRVVDDMAANAIEIVSDGGVLSPAEARFESDDSGGVSFVLAFERAQGASLVIRSPLIERLPRGHRQYIRVVDAAGVTISDGVLDGASNNIEVRLATTAAGGTAKFLQFLSLGVEHILTGYDHLAFIFALLVVGGCLRSVAKIVTSFTVAHSITLALAAFDVIRLQPGIVEPLIAASIVYVGLENLLRRDMKARWRLTFAFGLVHGLGFASALSGLGISSSSATAIIPIISFNLGVELGQLAVVVLVLPLIWRLRCLPTLAGRLVPAASLAVAFAGAFWLIARS
jgi:hydrogenase/urease accessory protein HupE